MIGDQISHFRVLERVGMGGMGEVFRAQDTRLGRHVALKFLPPELGRDADAKARFVQEAKAASALDHENVCTIYDIGETDEGRLFLAMSYYDGRSLKDLLADGPLEVDRALEITEQVARGLARAHERGITHRDIKPANVMITSDGVVKIVDFGLAKLSEDPGLTATGAVMGTPSYMSPEQARGESADYRTDLWSLGVVLYEMLAGQRPYEGETGVSILFAILHEEPEPVGARRPELTAATERLVESLMAKDRDARCSTAEEAVELVRLAREDEGISGASTTRRPPARRTRGPERAGLRRSLFVALVVGVVAALWALMGRADADDPDRSVAVLPFDSLGSDGATAFTDGVHGDILTRLAKVPDLSVTSRMSVMRFRDPDRPLPEIAQELGVQWVVLGEVQEVGTEVQVSARLVDSTDDRQVWAESFRRELTAEKLFEIQAEITEAIAAELQAELSPRESRPRARIPTDDLGAYRMFVEARAHLDQRTEDGMRAALDEFQRATDRDAEFALAWAGIGDACALLEAYAYAPRGSLLPRGFEAVETALELDPDLAEAHATHGLLLGNSGRPAEAFAEMTRAVELHPGYAEGQSWLSTGNNLTGHPGRALVRAERAVELSPLSLEARGNLALTAMTNGDFTRALREIERLKQLDPDFASGRFYEAVALHHLGRIDEARPLLEGLSVPWTGSGPKALLAVGLTRTGEADDARDLLADFDAQSEPFEIGLVQAALGKTDAAFAALERIDGSNMWATLGVRYFFPKELGPLRADPRWEAVIARLGAE